MLRYIPFKSISEKLFNHKGCRAECSVGSDYGRRGIKRKETARVQPKGQATPSLPLLKAQKSAIVQVSWLPQGIRQYPNKERDLNTLHQMVKQYDTDNITWKQNFICFPCKQFLVFNWEGIKFQFLLQQSKTPNSVPTSTIFLTGTELVINSCRTNVSCKVKQFQQLENNLSMSMSVTA